ncbi:MAG: Asp23/Gls24 family envelope stress response protein [Bacillota bacterium]|nr:Asp23/Gls24 family envelope stress response protein [Bacillota bacterium]
MLEIKTETGDIRFSKNVIKRIATDAVHQMDGKAYIYHYRGRYKNAMNGIGSRMSLYNGDKGDPGSIEVDDTDTGLRITVYLVVKFGVSIRSSCIDILNYIFDNVKSVMGEEPEIVKVIVTGVESNEIARRDLEYSREARMLGAINEPS